MSLVRVQPGGSRNGELPVAAIYLVNIDSAFQLFKKNPDRKSFALAVQASGFWQTPMFVLYSGKWSSTSAWLQDLSKQKKLTDSLLDSILDVIDSEGFGVTIEAGSNEA